MIRMRTGCCFLCVMVLAGVLYALVRMPVFEGGSGYELYLGTSSAPVEVSASPALFKLLHPDVTGESTRYEGDKSCALLTKYRAKVCFIEEAAGVTNYYCYSPCLGHGVLLFGEVINLHIAVRGERTAVGTPLIFGGS